MLSRINKPWGYYQVLEIGDKFQVKKIYVKSGGKLSLQSHKQRSEHWIVVAGCANVTIDGNKYKIGLNETIYIPLGSKHRLENNTEKDLTVIETQVGDYLGEDDIIRYEDIYDRKVVDDN